MKRRVIDVILIIVMILVGVLLRLPTKSLSSVDASVLSDPDSYLYARRAVEFANSDIGDWNIFTPRSEDPLMNTIDSNNDPFTTNLFPMLAALICKVFSFISIEKVIYYFCSILSSLTVIPVYLFVKKHSSRYGAIFAGFATSTSFSYLAHSIAGYFDTDAIIMLFATIIVLCEIELLAENNRKKQILFSIIQLITLVAFSFSWEAYYVYALISIALFVVYLICFRKGLDKHSLFIPLISNLVLFVYCLILSGDAAKGSLGRTIRRMIYGSNWPDESMYINELNHPSFISGGLNCSFSCTRDGFVNWLGGMSIFILLIASIVYFVIKLVKSNRNDEDRIDDSKKIVIISLIVWAVFTAPVVAFGIRFVQLFALPIPIIIGVAMGILYPNHESKKTWYSIALALTAVLFTYGALSRASIYVAIVVSSIMLLALIAIDIKNIKVLVSLVLISAVLCPVVSAFVYSNNNGSEIFVTKDQMAAVNYVNDNASPDAKIACWWNSGYYYQYSLNRQVTSDGGIYDGAYFYWLSNIFTSDNEKLSAGICRMLNSGSIEALRLAVDIAGGDSDATKLLKSILPLTREEAYSLLINEYSVDGDRAEELLSYTHNDYETYLIVTKTDVSISIPMAYFGLWDIDKRSSPTLNMTMDSDGVFKFPDELNNSLIKNIYEDKKMLSFERVYSNETAWVYRVVIE